MVALRKREHMTFKKVFDSRYDGMIVASFIFLLISFVTRSILFFISIKEIDLSIISTLQIFGVGLFFDLIVLLYLYFRLCFCGNRGVFLLGRVHFSI